MGSRCVLAVQRSGGAGNHRRHAKEINGNVSDTLQMQLLIDNVLLVLEEHVLNHAAKGLRRAALLQF